MSLKSSVTYSVSTYSSHAVSHCTSLIKHVSIGSNCALQRVTGIAVLAVDLCLQNSIKPFSSLSFSSPALSSIIFQFCIFRSSIFSAPISHHHHISILVLLLGGYTRICKGVSPPFPGEPPFRKAATAKVTVSVRAKAGRAHWSLVDAYISVVT